MARCQRCNACESQYNFDNCHRCNFPEKDSRGSSEIAEDEAEIKHMYGEEE